MGFPYQFDFCLVLMGSLPKMTQALLEPYTLLSLVSAAGELSSG